MKTGAVVLCNNIGSLQDQETVAILTSSNKSDFYIVWLKQSASKAGYENRIVKRFKVCFYKNLFPLWKFLEARFFFSICL